MIFVDRFCTRCGLEFVASALLCTATVSVAQIESAAKSASPETLAFDVAAVRQSKDSEPSSNVPLGPGNVYPSTHGILSAKSFPLLTYILFAYKLADYQVAAIKSSAPEWVLNDRFNIEARTDMTDVTKDELRLMMRTLLADRFKLVVHDEDRMVSVFALEPVKPAAMGPKLRRHPVAGICTSLKSMNPDGTSVDMPLQPEKGGFPAICSGIIGLTASAGDRWSFGAADVPMSLIASSLSSWGNLGRPVVDQTGLTGTFDFVLDYTPDPRPPYATVDSGGPSFQEALKQQLGLKLETKRAPVQFLVLDHVERSDPN